MTAGAVVERRVRDVHPAEVLMPDAAAGRPRVRDQPPVVRLHRPARRVDRARAEPGGVAGAAVLGAGERRDPDDRKSGMPAG